MFLIILNTLDLISPESSPQYSIFDDPYKIHHCSSIFSEFLPFSVLKLCSSSIHFRIFHITQSHHETLSPIDTRHLDEIHATPSSTITQHLHGTPHTIFVQRHNEMPHNIFTQYMMKHHGIPSYDNIIKYHALP